ncbi:MAG: PQQ-dependent sugar dehydrogenase [Bacteroidota bacterium]
MQHSKIYSSLAIYSLLIGIVISCQPARERLANQVPELNRFTTSTLTLPGTLDEPMAFTFLNEAELLIVERKGGVKSLEVGDKTLKTVGHIPVNTKYTNKEGRTREAEEGLVGVVADPNFAQNHFVYMLYADPGEAKHVLARWEYRDSLIQASKRVVLEYPVQRQECCHTGGGMVFDKAGNLFITTGNNTVNPPAGTSNLDERLGHENSDDQRTGGNTNDLRGKILRIHPEADGSYTIPEGNLFPEGTPNTRPEIYTMGHRNPWRVSIDSETGYIYWGEVGPDASEDTESNPRGYDEYNQAKGPGFFGWPYFIGDNKPYADTLGKPFSIEKVVNNSPNNTGLKELPAPQKAFIWYPYGYSEEFPLMGSAGRSATGGPVFRQADFPESDKRFPAYFEGKWLITEFMRGWIMAITMDENGDYLSMEPFLPTENFSSAIDMQFSPDGDLYLLEYGSAWFRGNENAQVKRIEYNGGNRKPIVKASADKSAGGLPFTAHLSAEGTLDYDKDPLSYQWTIESNNGFSQTIYEPNPSLTLDKEGVYTARLKVTDNRGNSNEQVLELIAGNEPPEVDLVIREGNQSFFFPGSPLSYQVQVQDLEDGKLEEGKIAPTEVAINFDYAPEGFDPIEIAQNHKASDDWVTFSKGKMLINNSDCLSCHKLAESSIGPSYQAVAQKYKDDPQSYPLIANRIVNGSVGIWGEHAMAAHPDISQQDAATIVDYIMGLTDPQRAPKTFSLAGTHTPEVPTGDNGKGGYLLRVAYSDKGNGKLRSLSAEKIIALRNPTLDLENFDEGQGIQLMTTPRFLFNVVEDQAFIAYKGLDLTGIREISLDAEASERNGAAGGIVEVYLDSPSGTLLGNTEKIVPLDIDFRAELQKLRAAWEKNGKKGPRPNYRTVREKFAPRHSIPLNDIAGKHDIYFVFKNAEAKPGQILIQLNGIHFIHIQPAS